MKSVTKMIVVMMVAGLSAFAVTPARAQVSDADLANVEKMSKFVEMMQTFVDTIQKLSDLAKDPVASGVAAAMDAKDQLAKVSPSSASSFLEETLRDAKQPAIRRAIRMQLIDIYKNTGNVEDAKKHLKAIMLMEDEK
jgi:predicted negative regulator of RcsB-dependent stress response